MNATPEEQVPGRWERIRGKGRERFARAYAWLEGRIGAYPAEALLNILAIPVLYYRELVWENDEAYGFALLRGLWQDGWLGKIALFGLTASLVLASSLLGQSGAGFSDNLSLGLTLLIYSLAWAFALTAGMLLPLYGLVILASYMLFYGLIMGGSLAGTLPFCLPALWALFLGWRAACTAPSRWRRLWLLLLCLASANLCYGAFGFNRLLPLSFNLPGRILLGLVFFGLLANPWMLPAVPRGWKPLPAGLIFALSLACGLAYLALAWAKNSQLTADNTLLALKSILGLVDLAWFWLGWTLFEGALDLGDLASQQLEKIITPKATTLLFPLFWILGTLFCGLAVHPLPLPLAVLADSIGLAAWAQSIDDSLWFTLFDFLYIGLAVLGLALILRLARKLNGERLTRLNGLWIAGLAALLWYYESMGAFATLEEDAAAPVNFWPGLVLIGGIVWELARGVASYLEPDARSRLYLVSATLLMTLGISFYTLNQQLPDLVMEYTLYSFLGVLYLGLPLVVYTFALRLVPYEPVPGIQLLGLFGLGMLSAVIVLGISWNASAVMGLAPLAWLGVLLLLGKPLGRLENPLDGLAAGGALGLGFTTFWMAPQLLPVPFVSALNTWQLNYLSQPYNRPILLPAQTWLTVICLGAGLFLGLSFTTKKHKTLWVSLALTSAVLLLALGAPAIPGIPLQ